MLLTSATATPSISDLLGLPAVDWLVVVVGIVILGWFILSNWEKLERVAGWLSAGRRRREAAVNERLEKAEKEIREFVARAALDELFIAIDKQLKLHGAELLAGKEARHTAQHEHDALTGEVRRNRLDIEKLQHLEPRLHEAEKSIAVIIQKMSDLEKGQERIITNQDTNLDTILQAIRDKK